MRGKIILAAVLMFTFFFASQASAQDFYIGVKFGLSFQEIKFNDIAVDFENESDTIFGFRMGAKVKNFGIDASYFQAEQSLRAKGTVDPDLDIDRLKLNYFGVNLLYYIGIPVVKPYITAGYGFYKVDVAGFDKDSSGGFNAGIGANAKINKYISISAEGKYHWANLELEQTRMELRDLIWNISVNFHF